MSTDNISAFLARSKELHEKVKEILTWTSPQDVQQEMEARLDMKQDLFVLYNSLKDKIAEVEQVGRKVREARSQQRVDVDKLTSYKILIYQQRKQLNL